MPYFLWRGIDIKGRTQRGKIFARSEQELDTLLFKREIALLKYTIARTWSLSPTIKQETKIHFFSQLASLMHAGLLLHDALSVLAPQISNIRFQQIVITITDQINQGTPLSVVLSQYPQVFDTVTIHMMHVGQESGTIALCAEMVADHLLNKHELKKQLYSAMMMPFITLLFFIVIFLVIFIAVIPIFADIFASTHTQLPFATQIMVMMSNFLRSLYALPLVVILALVVVAGKQFITRNKSRVDGLMLHVPIAGYVVRKKCLFYFAQSLSLLIKGGMQLVPALHITQKSIDNDVFNRVLIGIEQEVTAGSSLSQACARQQEWFEQDMIAMLLVGQEAGQLSEMLQRIARLHEGRIKETLSFVTKIIQPLLMVFLGLLVTTLLFSIYMPILSISQAITTT